MSGIPVPAPPNVLQAWRSMPGSSVIPLFGVAGVSTPWWIDFTFGPAGMSTAPANVVNFTNPESGQSHSFGEFQMTVNDATFAPAYVCIQLLLFDARVSNFVFSNLQAEYL